MNDNEIIEELKNEKKEMKIKYAVILVIVSIIVAVLASEATITYYGLKTRVYVGKTEYSENPTQNINAIAKSLQNFRKTIDAEYIGDIDEKKMMDETIKGYVNGLGDEYSEYMTKEDWEEFQENVMGNYVGIGVYMTVDDNKNTVIINTIKDSPAEAAGLQPEDIIAKVNDEDVLGISSDVVSNMIRGEEGTKVKLTLVRDGNLVEVEVERKTIRVYRAESELLEGNIGYIYLYTFDDGVAEDFKNEYNSLKQQGATKFILDLRNNTGGVVTEAVSIADMLLEKDKKILITKDAKGKEEIDKSNKNPIVTEDLVVLVNQYTASASEILTSALKDNGRATIVGTKTFGKGVIQSVFALRDGGILKLTTAEYFTANNDKINKVGITPDYELELDYENKIDTQLDKAKELLK